ncbi:MAG: phage virion morphogenesis protein [Pseudomonadota bacterium]
MVGSNKRYAAIHQFGGQAGRKRRATLPARPYLGPFPACAGMNRSSRVHVYCPSYVLWARDPDGHEWR